MSIFALDKLIAQARKLAADYRRATGKSLPISSEIAKHDACVQLKLDPVEKDSGGHDALGTENEWRGLRIQIKGRAIFDESKKNQRIGQLKLEKEWDGLVLVVMNEEFEPVEMYFAARGEVEAALSHDSSRSERGAMSLARFRNIAQLVWTAEQGKLVDVTLASQPTS